MRFEFRAKADKWNVGCDQSVHMNDLSLPSNLLFSNTGEQQFHLLQFYRRSAIWRRSGSNCMGNKVATGDQI